MEAGIEICKKTGDKVEIGEILGYIYTNDEIKVQTAVADLKNVFHITSKKVKRYSKIIETLK